LAIVKILGRSLDNQVLMWLL